MTAVEIEIILRALSDKLTVLDDEMPEMTTVDWARDHGWISDEDWLAADTKAKENVHQQEIEIQTLELLRQNNPQAMTEFAENLLFKLKKLQKQLKKAALVAKKQNTEFPMTYNLSLLPKIIETIEDWHLGKKTKNWLPWAWRVVFQIAAQCEKYID